MICAADGGIIDDLIVYRVAADRFLVVPNASNREVVVDELRERLAGHDAALDDASLRTSLVAVQGPRAAELLGPLTDVDLASLKYYAIAEGHACGKPAHIARTGYTGEDGFELFVDWDDAVPVWDRCSRRRAAGSCRAAWARATRCGWRRACRCTATSSTATRNPFEAGLGRVVKLDKAGRLRRAARRSSGSLQTGRHASSWSGMTLDGRGIARHGYPVMSRRRRRADGRRDQRRAVADAGHAHRDGLRAARRRRGRYHGRSRDPRARASTPRSSRCRSTSAPPSGAPAASRERTVQVPDDLRYTPDHEWLRVEGDEAVVGITAYAAEQLGDVVFVELPAVGASLEAAQRSA